MRSDIKDAGMLVYHILSGAKHPFEVLKYCDMENDVQDIEARNLINWMVNNAVIDEVLKHPFFWNKKRKEEVLRKLGDQPEVQYYIDISKVCKTRKAEEGLTAREAVERTFSNKKDKSRKTTILTMLGEIEEVQNKNLENLSKLCDSAKTFTQDKTFNKWKSELIDEWPDINKDLPEDLIGLLRVFRNKLTHGGFDEQMFDRFPDFFISLHRLAIDMGWDCTWS
ncbi:uncharacterized protein LOC127162960 [Labeo rohita]|uniref:uncharacterized protein LOC127162960 n=1 Tax=Labeo rohita TaxID=84645 RepID=UPI0021E32823|nr:uncharacterized protein LOC127162960 [Labeo rohita]